MRARRAKMKRAHTGVYSARRAARYELSEKKAMKVAIS